MQKVNLFAQTPPKGKLREANRGISFKHIAHLNATWYKVFINDNQYFANMPEVAWNFYIGGYQPAQKWLKDLKGRKLECDDIMHYQKIIVALAKTDRVMKVIDEIEIE